LKLNKSLYGAPQAGRNWNRDINNYIISLGFKSFTKDPCIYIKIADDMKVIICLYVDDLLICARDNDIIMKIKYDLGRKYKLNDLGNVTKFLGMRFRQYNDRLEIDLDDYIDKMLKRFNMTDCIPCNMPASTSLILSRAQCPSTEEECSAMSNVPYRELVGSLLFAATTIIPEISTIVSKLAEFMTNPGHIHWNEAKKVLRYLKYIKGNKFIMRKTMRNTSDKYALYGYVDADWAADRDNRRSRAGYVFKLGQSIVSWTSTLEPTVALSSAESELMAATLAAKQAIYLRDLLKFLGHIQLEPTILFEDNTACIRLSKHSEFHKRTKHIDIRWFYIREKFISNEINLIKIASHDNVADLFTKIVNFSSFQYLSSKLYDYYRP
jgi:hypothetical protein